MRKILFKFGLIAVYYEFNSAYGLAHLGDYETTLFSEYSHNRRYGEMMAHGAKFDKLAEGLQPPDFRGMCFPAST